MNQISDDNLNDDLVEADVDQVEETLVTEISPVVAEEVVAEEEVLAAEIDSVVKEEVKTVAESKVTEEKVSTEDEIPASANFPWYVVHTYSGFEARVKLTLEERVRNAKLQDKFGKIIVPQEQVVELVRGEKKTSSRKFFPGYMLIQCELNDETWHLVANTPKVTGFVGDTRNPVPLSAQEVQNLFMQMEGGAKKPRPKVQFEDGDSVKVVDGPFADFNGVVDEVKPDKGKLRVLISIFGRNTPVELDFVQVEKV
jgi:transcriptional antiterminator NusG